MSPKASFAVAGSVFTLGGTVLLALWILSSARIDGEAVPRDRPTSADRAEPSGRPPGTGELIERLRRTALLNGEEIHDRLGLRLDERNGGQTTALSSGGRGSFATLNQYEPAYRERWRSPAALAYPLPENAQSYEVDESKGTFLFHGQEPVLRWYSSLDSDTEVCGVQFVDAERVQYRLRTFADRQSALADGYFVTHRHHCGTCSSLRDLAVYLEKPDLTTPARTCARKWTAGGVKICLMEEIGFEAHCAETWTYNVLHTRRHCAATCIGHYGLWKVLSNGMGDAHADEGGNLNPCLACDEYTSGPGFRYAAGRTRRSSGLTSAIDRPSEELFPVDHGLYFE